MSGPYMNPVHSLALGAFVVWLSAQRGDNCPKKFNVSVYIYYLPLFISGLPWKPPPTLAHHTTPHHTTQHRLKIGRKLIRQR